MSSLRLEVERRFEVAPGDVFDAFLDLYGDSRPDWIVSSDLDPRVGGEWNVTFEPPGVERFEERRAITRLERPAAIAYDVRVVHGDGGEFEVAVSIDFEEAEDGCLVRLRQGDFPDPETRDDFASAWPEVLALLDERVGGG
jgi:uncharacterized protein YndB with AHSA1/START domain